MEDRLSADGECLRIVTAVDSVKFCHVDLEFQNNFLAWCSGLKLVDGNLRPVQVLGFPGNLTLA